MIQSLGVCSLALLLKILAMIPFCLLVCQQISICQVQTPHMITSYVQLTDCYLNTDAKFLTGFQELIIPCQK